MVQKKTSPPNWGPDVNSLPHCPDFDERFTLTDGKTRAVPFPEVSYTKREKNAACKPVGLQGKRAR